MKFDFLRQPNDPDALTTTSQLDAVLCACVPSLVVPMLMRAVEEGRWDEGPTNAAKRERIEAIDDRIRKASKEITDLRTQAAEASLDV